MVKIVGTKPERLGTYKTAQKVVFSVLTIGVTVWVASSEYPLRASARAGVFNSQQGFAISPGTQVQLDVQGDLFWKASAENVQVDVLETGAL